MENVSKKIKDRIKKIVSENDVEGYKDLRKWYKKSRFDVSFFNLLETEDLISIFSIHEVNFIKFFLNNSKLKDIEIDFDPEVNDIEDYFVRRKMKLMEIRKGRIEEDHYFFGSAFDRIPEIIREAIIVILETYQFDSYDDPFFMYDFIDAFQGESLKELIHGLPRQKIYHFLRAYLGSWGGPCEGMNALKELNDENKLNLQNFIIDSIQKQNLEEIELIWRYWLWDLLKMDTIGELLKNPSINFFENLLLMARAVLIDLEIPTLPWNDSPWEDHYLLPPDLEVQYWDTIETNVIKLIKKNEDYVFPLLYDLNYINRLQDSVFEELIKEPKNDLFTRIYQALKEHKQRFWFIHKEWIYYIDDLYIEKLERLPLEEFSLDNLKKMKNQITPEAFRDHRPFDRFKFQLEKLIHLKEGHDFTLNVPKLMELISKAKGNDELSKGVIETDGYTFVFRLHTHVKPWSGSYNSKCFNLRPRYHVLMEGIEFAAKLKTLLPDIKLGGDEILFHVWVFIQTPEGDMFPVDFYFGASGLAIGGYKRDDPKFPGDFKKLITSDVFSLDREQIEHFRSAFKNALLHVHPSEFKCIHSDDSGTMELTCDSAGPNMKRINSK